MRMRKRAAFRRREGPVKRFSVLVYCRELQEAAGLREALRASGRADVKGVASVDLAEALRRHAPDVLLVSLESEPHQAFDAIEALPVPRPAVLVCGREDDHEVLLRAMRLEVKDFLPAVPTADALAAAFDGLASAGVVATRPDAPLVAIAGAKSGVGTTSVACQLAITLQELGSETVLVDLAYPTPEVALHLDLPTSEAFAMLSRRSAALDATCLTEALRTHASGIRVLVASSNEEAFDVGSSLVEEALELLRERFDWVVVDAGQGRTQASARALELADQLLLVTRLDVPALHQLRSMLERLRRAGRSEEEVRLVVNRASAGRSISEADLVAFLGRAPDARLPRDDSAMERAVNHGRPLGQVASASPLRNAYLELARRVHEWRGSEPPTAPRKRRPALRSVIHRLRRHPLQEPRAETGTRRFRVLTVTSNKGGVAKTTLATNLAVYFRALDEDLPILIVGLDDQAMLERMFSLGAEKPRENVLTAVRAGSLDGAIRLGQYGVHYVPTSEHVGDLKREIDDLFHLRRVLERTNWKGLVILDTKSDFEILTRNAIAASNLSIVIVHDQASLMEARKVYDFLDRLGRPREQARVVLSLVDRRIKFRQEDDVDILGHLVSEIRRRGYPLLESFVSRSPKVEALYTNPEGRAVSILHGAGGSLVHLQMTHLARDVLEALKGGPRQEVRHQWRDPHAALRLSA